MINVHRTLDLPMLEHLKQVLLDHQIPCFTKNENPVGGAMGEVPPIVCNAELWIHHDQQLERAKGLIEQVVFPVQGSDWTCANCEEELTAAFTQCWNCGTVRESETRSAAV
ncbi:MAG: DUF2007 domain-containing protein [Acidobacteriota bacterium]|nr:DUF2007 domain-containing protein [Acidobacteriota bacterium]